MKGKSKQRSVRIGVRKIRVLLADDHEPFLSALTRLLGHDFDVAGAVFEAETLLDEARRLQPDVVVVDLAMPGLNGIEATRLLKDNLDVAVVLLTSYGHVALVQEALDAGAIGYVTKSNASEDLPQALDCAVDGRTFISEPLRSEMTD